MPSAKTAKHANDVEIKNQKNIPKSTIPKIEAIKSRSNLVEAPIYKNINNTARANSITAKSIKAGILCIVNLKILLENSKFLMNDLN